MMLTEKMCKSVEAYAQKRVIEGIENLARNGASIELVLASFPDVSKDEVQSIFDNIVKKNHEVRS